MQIALKLASLYVWFERMADYEVLCRRVMRQAEALEQEDDVVAVIRLACLGPGMELSSAEPVAALAKKALAHARSATMSDPRIGLALGISAYRANRMDESLTYFTEACRMADQNSRRADHDTICVAASFYIATIWSRTGNAVKAEQLFASAKSKMKALPGDPSIPLAGTADYEALMQWLAYREAEAVFK